MDTQIATRTFILVGMIEVEQHPYVPVGTGFFFVGRVVEEHSSLEGSEKKTQKTGMVYLGKKVFTSMRGCRCWRWSGARTSQEHEDRIAKDADCLKDQYRRVPGVRSGEEVCDESFFLRPLNSIEYDVRPNDAESSMLSIFRRPPEQGRELEHSHHEDNDKNFPYEFLFPITTKLDDKNRIFFPTYSPIATS